MIDKTVREMQLQMLKEFAPIAGSFALAGGTALELYYLHHRFSRDLDFFSPQYDAREIETIVAACGARIEWPITLENELLQGGRARLRFYLVNHPDRPLKIDFVEDVVVPAPRVRRVESVPVYEVLDLYRHKLAAITGTRTEPDATGREEITGRQSARDTVDVYYLSRNVRPLRLFLREVPRIQQRGMVQWFHRFPRQEFREEFLDLAVYDRELDSRSVIKHLDDEIQAFVREELP